jgi:hypothetical protein
MAVHWALYARFAPRFRSDDLELRRSAVLSYFKWLAAWEAAVLLAAVAYLLVLRSAHPSGLAWIAPAVGAVVGNALPLQLVVVAVSRASR